MPNEDAVCECRPDYEIEYYRLIEEVKQLKSENVVLKDTILGMCEYCFAQRRINNAE